MIDELDARDELCQTFDTGWKNSVWLPVQDGDPPRIIYEGREDNTPPDITLPFARFTIDPLSGNQASLAGDMGQKKWKNGGLISVQCFGPLDRGDGFEVAEYMAIMAKRIYQGESSPNGIWFRKCRTERVGKSGGWYQFNVLIEYTFDELR